MTVGKRILDIVKKNSYCFFDNFYYMLWFNCLSKENT